MKLPVIKHLTEFIESNDEDYIVETLETLEALTEVTSLKDEELDVIGELISNMYGALEVHNMIKEGRLQKDALNSFMKRVLGSIDTKL
jgi:Mg2+/Co2+ transporter CorC